jgi:iron complex outermembrane receptor protein
VDAWHQERVGFRADLASNRDTYFAEGDAYRGNSPHIIGTTPVYDETSGGDINLRWDRAFSQTNGFYVQAYFDRNLRTDPKSLGESRNTVDIDFIQHVQFGKRNKFSYGGGLRWSPYAILSTNPDETLIPTRATDHIYTGFLQDEVQLATKFALTFGTKLQQNNYSGFDIQPSVRLLWSPDQHQVVWMGATRAVTTPSDLEEDFVLRAAAPKLVIQVLGNKRFKSEDVTGYELGYRLLRDDRFYLDLSSFWSQYSNLQSFSAPAVTVAGGVTTSTILYENQIAGHTSGFEFAPQLAITRWWHLNSSYSFVSSNFGANGPTSNISSTGSVSTYEGSTPKHLVSVQSKLNLPMRFEFDQIYRFASALPAQKVKAYQTMDLVIARPIGRQFSLKIVGQDLFQPYHYEWGTGDPTQQPVGIYRAAYVQLSFRTSSPR